MNPEIQRILDEHCEDCIVYQTIRKEHTIRRADSYCRTLCPHGLKMQKLSVQQGLGKITKGLKLTEDQYLEYKEEGLSDEEIATKHNISRSTLKRRKRKWGLLRGYRRREKDGEK